MDAAYSNRPTGGFTKLFSTIIHSTVWRADMHVKVVWVTMLAMADRNGRVWSSLPGLADASRVSLEQCQEALAVLAGPDEYSRTKANEGRRIVEIDGGWELLNYLKYRELRNEDERRLQTREAVARYRAKKATVSQSKPRKPKKAQAEAEAEAEAESREDQHPRASRSASVPPDFDAFWSLYPKKTGKGAALKVWAKLSPPIEAVRAALAWQVNQPGWQKSGGQFIPHPATWLNAHGWTDEPFQAPTANPLAANDAVWAEVERLHTGRRES